MPAGFWLDDMANVLRDCPSRLRECGQFMPHEPSGIAPYVFKVFPSSMYLFIAQRNLLRRDGSSEPDHFTQTVIIPRL